MNRASSPSLAPDVLLRRLLRQAPLYAIFDTGLRPGLSPLAVAASLLAAGVRVIQYRHKGQFRREHFEQCCALAETVRPAGGLFFVNDRADVAVLCGAAGVHVGQQDLPPEKVRRFLGAQQLLGYSTHNRQQVERAAALPVDYIAIGPVFPTATKANPDPVVGLEGVREARSLTAKPLVAIGGISLATALSVLRAGADAVAVIGDLLLAPDIAARAREWMAALRGRSADSC
ncbi:MAG TPA: thiamine phosphate synthase [Terriglobia bacterium]|nr:thiamine phosphate synthase [Terriglobia bacterium]